MTPADLRTLRRRLGLTQTAAARLCGVAFRTWQSWEREERSIPQPVARLLAAVERDPGLREWLEGREAA